MKLSLISIMAVTASQSDSQPHPKTKHMARRYQLLTFFLFTVDLCTEMVLLRTAEAGRQFSSLYGRRRDFRALYRSVDRDAEYVGVGGTRLAG